MFSLLKKLFFIILLPIFLVLVYTWITLNWVYSSGDRAGYVQKLSQKGFICKTYEGELILVTMPGTQAEKFYFSVRDTNVAKKINETVGQRVRLVYEQHKGVPSNCFGESEYFVTNVFVIPEKNQ